MIPRRPLAVFLVGWASAFGFEEAALLAQLAARPELASPLVDAEEEPKSAMPNIRGSTLGGMQFWSDEFVFHDYRIQRNVLTGHCRLLDASDKRLAWGSFDQCQQQWKSTRRENAVPPLKPHVVLTLHGLGRTRHSMEPMGEFLRKHGDFSVLNVSYASTRETLDEHAAALARIIGRLEGVSRVSFVAHSLGNLVVRRYLDELKKNENRSKPLPATHRIVMLGPPNQGAQMAERLRDLKLFHAVMGSSGTTLAGHWSELEQRLAIPSCQFGIIAGGTGKDDGLNPLVSGDDDLVVSVDETRLAGARDFIVVPVVHTLIMDHPRARECTLRFLRDGHFLSEEQRCPIPRSQVQPDPR